MAKVPLTEEHLKTHKFVLNVESVGLSPEQFFRLCGDNPELRLELTAQKEIIVMSNGEKVPPLDMEAAIARDSLFEQTMLIGEARPYLAVLAVLNAEQWKKTAAEAGLDAQAALHSEAAEKLVLARIVRQLRDFPGYAQVRRAAVSLEPWSVENGLLTPTLKLRRPQVMEHYKKRIAKLYEGH